MLYFIYVSFISNYIILIIFLSCIPSPRLFLCHHRRNLDCWKLTPKCMSETKIISREVNNSQHVPMQNYFVSGWSMRLQSIYIKTNRIVKERKRSPWFLTTVLQVMGWCSKYPPCPVFCWGPNRWWSSERSWGFAKWRSWCWAELKKAPFADR